MAASRIFVLLPKVVKKVEMLPEQVMKAVELNHLQDNFF